MRKRFLGGLAGVTLALMIGGIGPAGAAATCTPSPGPQAYGNSGTCLPTPQQCATGGYNGAYNGGTPGRAAVCAGSSGHIAYYSGGNANTPCGVIIVADQTVIGNPNKDPNTCL